MNAPDRAFGLAMKPQRVGRKPVARRVWRYAVEHWVAHLTLIALAGLFVFPFVWMLGLSLKTDDEATGNALFPAVPTFRATSPFVRDADAVARPDQADGDKWARVEPQLRSAARAAIDKLPLPPGANAADGEALRDAAATEAIRRGLAKLDGALWTTSGDDAIVAPFRAGLTDAELSSLLLDRLGRIELGAIQIRSLSGHVTPVGARWQVVSGDAELVPSGATQVLKYAFADASAQPVVVRATFDAKLTADELHRVVVPYKGDASWHRVDADFRLGGNGYVSERATYVAQHRGASLLLQPPTFQDETLGPRAWVSLKPLGMSDPTAQPTQASLTLTMTPSSTVRAVWGKVERNYARAFRSVPFWTYVGNSVIIVVLQVAGALFSSAFVGYAFARLRWPGRSIAMGVLLATMMLPGQVTMIPSFLIWKHLGWYNTLNPLWVGAWLGNAFFIFLMVQNMRTIPKELDEAARIDGMNALQTWWYVIVPQVKPTLAAIAIMTFMGAWNEFMGPLIMLRDQTLFPLSLGLYAMRMDAGTDWPLIMAGNLLMTLPVIAIFFCFQRYFIEGSTVTGMKG